MKLLPRSKPSTVNVDSWNSQSSATLLAILQRSLALWSPPPCLKIWEWAELRRRLGRNVTAKPGTISGFNRSLSTRAARIIHGQRGTNNCAVHGQATR